MSEAHPRRLESAAGDTPPPGSPEPDYEPIHPGSGAASGASG